MKNVTLEEVLAGESPEMRERVEIRTAQLVAEELTLREFREKLALTQKEVAKELGIGQESVSRLERRNDMLVSTLSKTLQAMGGSLLLMARIPDRGLVELVGLGDDSMHDA